MTDQTHGQKRLGLLTSSTAHIIMHGGQGAWETLRDKMWTETADDFDQQTTGARAFGHENEEAGVAKFFEMHPEVLVVRKGGFHVYQGDGPLKGWMGSSPDRELLVGKSRKYGLEVKSPTSEDLLRKHTLKQHVDQCQHGLLVTGWNAWYLFAHFDNKHQESLLLPDKLWQSKYLQRAELFHKFVYEGRPVKRRKLSIHDIKE